MKEIRHRRWRHRRDGYTVTVLGVANYGYPVTSQTVEVDRSLTSSKPKVWDINHFLESFDPIGRPRKRPSFWDHLLDPKLDI